MKIDFNSLYEGIPPWDIGHPQPVIIELEDEGRIQGCVLDVGCGTGENACFLATRAHSVCGIDLSARAIEKARNKNRERALPVDFKCMSALELESIGKHFDTVIDSGLFHVFSDEERLVFEQSLRNVIQPGGRYIMLCFSDAETREESLRRVSEREIRDLFGCGWRVETIEPSIFEAHLYPDGSRAWLAIFRRLEDREV